MELEVRWASGINSPYPIVINTMEELIEFIADTGHEVIINAEGRVLVYDDHVE